jgi:cysteine desulfurase
MDNAATTPVRSEVLAEMLPYFSEKFGNPSSLYPLAQHSYDAISRARKQVANALGCMSNEVVFTSGGTESDNTAIKGVVQKMRPYGNHIITSAIEHHAVLNTCKFLESVGFDVTYLPVDQHGMIDPNTLEEKIREDTILVSIMYANNEIGTVQPIHDISVVIKHQSEKVGHPIVFHTDAVQAPGYLSLNVNELGIDLLSLSSHKFNGPKGCGILFIRKDTPFEPTQLGGGQEQTRRSGTENVAAIVGTGLALELASSESQASAYHCTNLTKLLIEGVMERLSDTKVNGHPIRRLPNNAHFTFDNLDGEALVLKLAREGIAASTGSACSTGSLEPSHVLEAIGIARETAWGSLRLTISKENSERDILETIEAVVSSVNSLRRTLQNDTVTINTGPINTAN